LKKELYESVIKGDLHPREYATLYEWSNGDIRATSDTSSIIVYMLDSIGTMTPVRVKQIDNSKDLEICQPSLTLYEYRVCKVMSIAKYFDNQRTTNVNNDIYLIGIASLEHDERKKAYALKHKMTLFFGVYSAR